MPARFQSASLSKNLHVRKPRLQPRRISVERSGVFRLSMPIVLLCSSLCDITVPYLVPPRNAGSGCAILSFARLLSVRSRNRHGRRALFPALCFAGSLSVLIVRTILCSYPAPLRLECAPSPSWSFPWAPSQLLRLPSRQLTGEEQQYP